MKFNTKVKLVLLIRHLLSQKNVSFRSIEFVWTVQSHDTVFCDFSGPKTNTRPKSHNMLLFIFEKCMILMYQSRGFSMIIV